jgi:hypothetical protein
VPGTSINGPVDAGTLAGRSAAAEALAPNGVKIIAVNAAAAGVANRKIRVIGAFLS